MCPKSEIAEGTQGGQTAEIKENLSNLANLDLNAKRKEFYFAPPGPIKAYLDSSLCDERDQPIAYAFFNVSLITVPAAAAVWYLQNPWVGLIYLLSNVLTFQERFTLGLHYSSHRRLFKDGILNCWAPYLLAPFFGIPPGVYYLHHCVMHHCENNIFPWDLSSTEPYQRDNFLHFMCYWFRYMFAIWVELPYYALKRGRTELAIHAACIAWGYVAAVYMLYQYNPSGTTWVVIAPYMMASFLLMFGNWSQHIFVDPEKPENNYKLSYNIVNAPSNQRNFNDGYHIEHHLQSKRHWTDMPTNYMKNLDKYAAEDAIIFKGSEGPAGDLDFIAVGAFVFLRQYGILSKMFVQTKEPKRDRGEIEKLLRSRLVPIRRDESGKQIRTGA